jgi:hypothetical protein
MDKLGFYRQALKETIQAQADLMNSQPVAGEEVDCVFDEQRDHYLLLNYGWPRGRHTHYTKVHARIHNGKIWIEEDATEEGLANELAAAGIPKDDIVLGFNPPLMRQHSDFATA